MIRELIEDLRNFSNYRARDTLYYSSLAAIPEKLEYAWAQKPKADECIPFKRQLLVTPGNGSVSTIESICYQLLTEPESLGVVVSQRDNLGLEFAGFFEELEWPILLCPFAKHEEKLKWVKALDADFAVLYGSDETCQLYEQQLDPRARVIKYGSKTSIGVHFVYPGEEGFVSRFVQEYAKDFFSYDGTGCLNTSALYIVGGSEKFKDYRNFIELLVRERDCHIDKRAVPSSKTSQLTANMIRSGVEFQQDQGVFLREPVKDFSTLGMGNGTAVIVPCEFEDVLDEWQRGSRLLSSATLFAPTHEFDLAAKRLFDLGVTRITKPGQAQSPTKRWKHDGMALIPVWGREVSLDV